MIFGTNVTQKVSNQKMLYFPALNNQCFCTTWETGNPEIAYFHLNPAFFLPKHMKHIQKYYFVTD